MNWYAHLLNITFFLHKSLIYLSIHINILHNDELPSQKSQKEVLKCEIGLKKLQRLVAKQENN